MISRKNLKQIAKARLKDSKILCKNGRYDGAVYLCGYAVEVTLKAKICKTLNWKGFPESSKEFEHYKSFKTHNLDVLLKLSGHELVVKSKYLADWSIIAQWDPEVRYKQIGSAAEVDAKNIISSTRNILGAL
ncbi:MAG: HEPN domain-containing protein [Candidatus Saganbacteria bacterium]|nr:HEPN domain-containing protein [Candidatus Saganbacteria bacterium]